MPEQTRTSHPLVLILMLTAILLGAGVAFELLMITWPIPLISAAPATESTPASRSNTSSAGSCASPSGPTPASSSGTKPEGGPGPTPTPSTAWGEAQALIARWQKQLIPRNGQTQDYGAALTDEGYQTLLQWNNELKVEASYADAFESLDMRLPCCDWSKPSRDEKTNCGCGHHQALEGLSKKLLSEGWAREAVQHEVTRWSDYFFPK